MKIHRVPAPYAGRKSSSDMFSQAGATRGPAAAPAAVLITSSAYDDKISPRGGSRTNEYSNGKRQHASREGCAAGKDHETLEKNNQRLDNGIENDV